MFCWVFGDTCGALMALRDALVSFVLGFTNMKLKFL